MNRVQVDSSRGEFIAEEMEPLEGGSFLENAMACLCPCYVYGETIGYLKNVDSVDASSCCIWTCIESAGIAGSIGAGALAPAVPGGVFYFLILIGNCIPHWVWVLPLALEMKAFKIKAETSYDTRSILETLVCPCCILASVKKWAKQHKGDVGLKQLSGCILPPMKLISPPRQLSMKT
jgi:hypothetical protein